MKLSVVLLQLALAAWLVVACVGIDNNLRTRQQTAEPTDEAKEPPTGGAAVVAAVKAVKDAALVHLSTLKMEQKQTDAEFEGKLAESQKAFDEKKNANDRVMDCIQANKNLGENADKRLKALNAKQEELRAALASAKKAMQVKQSAKQTFKNELEVWSNRLQGDSEGRLKDLLDTNKQVMDRLAQLPESVTGSLATVETVFLEEASSELPEAYQNPDESALKLSSGVMKHDSLIPADDDAKEDYMTRLLNRQKKVEANSYGFVFSSLAGLLSKYKNAKDLLPKGTPKVDASAAFTDIMQTLSRLELSIREQSDKKKQIDGNLRKCSDQAETTGSQLELVKAAHEKLLGHQAESSAFYAKRIAETKEEIKFASDSIIWMSQTLENKK